MVETAARDSGTEVATTAETTTDDEVQWSWARKSIQRVVKGKINIYSRTSIIGIIEDELKNIGDDVYQQFRECCFGFFTQFDRAGNSCNVAIHGIVAHEVTIPNTDPGEIWFRIGGRFIRFSKYEYALVTGLSFRPSTFDPSTEHVPPEIGIFRRYYRDRVKMDSLRSDFVRGIFRQSPEDGLKVAKMLFVYFFLFAHDGRATYIDDWAWTLIEDDAMWESFLWGKYSYQILIRYIRHMRSDTTASHLYGFVWAFLIWAYEAIPSLGHCCGVRGDQIRTPRCLRWSFKRQYQYGDLRGFFDRLDLEVHSTLQPTLEEQHQHYWEHVGDDLRMGICYVHRDNPFKKSTATIESSSVGSDRKRRRIVPTVSDCAYVRPTTDPGIDRLPHRQAKSGVDAGRTTAIDSFSNVRQFPKPPPRPDSTMLVEIRTTIREEVEQYVSRLERQHAEHVNRIERQHEEHVARMERQHAEHVARMERQHAEHVARMERQHAEHVARLQTHYEEHITSLGQRFDDGIAQIRQHATPLAPPLSTPASPIYQVSPPSLSPTLTRPSPSSTLTLRATPLLIPPALPISPATNIIIAIPSTDVFVSACTVDASTTPIFGTIDDFIATPVADTGTPITSSASPVLRDVKDGQPSQWVLSRPLDIRRAHVTEEDYQCFLRSTDQRNVGLMYDVDHRWFMDLERSGPLLENDMGSRSQAKKISDSERNEYKEKPYEINLKTENPDEVQIKYYGKILSLSSMVQEKDQLHSAFCEETRKLQRISDEHIKRFCEQEIALENKKRRLDSWSEELNKREEFIERERQKLEEEKMKRTEAFNEERLELEWRFEYEKHKLGFDEIRQMPKIWQEAFDKLFVGFCNLLTSSGTNIIGIKRMGGIDEETFRNGCNKRFPVEGAHENEADELCSLWQEKLRNREWNPFKIAVNKHGNAKILLNEDDDLLRGLKVRWGDEVYDAVITALKELQFKRPSRFWCQFPLLWNFIENREATIKEVIAYIIVQLRTLKRTTP